MSYYMYRDTELFYTEHGDGIPFLLIHGWAIEHTFLEKALEPIFENLRTPIRRIYIDIPGMGLSKPGFVKNGDGIIEVLDAFMEDIAPGEQYYIGGNSFGSVVARALAARRIDRTLGLMLIAPGSQNKGLNVPQNGICSYDKEFAGTLPEDEVNRFLLMHANLNKDTWERYMSLAYPSVLANEDNVFLHSVLKGKFSFEINRSLEKQRFDKPTLILTGKYDIAVGYEDQFGWLSTFKKGTYIVVDCAGHNIHIDCPDMFYKSVYGWLEEYVCR